MDNPEKVFVTLFYMITYLKPPKRLLKSPKNLVM